MQGGLVHTGSDYVDAGEFYAMGASAGGPGAGGNNSNSSAESSPRSSSMNTDVDVSGTEYASIDSHLDSFFQSHAVTREDVLVLAGVFQAAMWLALLYLEVSDR